MRTHASILESLKINRINEASLYKGFERYSRFKVMKDNSLGYMGEFFFLFNAWDDQQSLVFYQMRKGDTIQKIKNFPSKKPVAIPMSVFDKYISSGSVIPIDTDEDVKKGDVDVEDIKDIVANLGLSKILGIPWTRIVKTSGKHWTVSLGQDKAIQDEYYPLIVNALAKRGIKVANDDPESNGGYDIGKSTIYINKVQV